MPERLIRKCLGPAFAIMLTTGCGYEQASPTIVQPDTPPVAATIPPTAESHKIEARYSFQVLIFDGKETILADFYVASEPDISANAQPLSAFISFLTERGAQFPPYFKVIFVDGLNNDPRDLGNTFTNKGPIPQIEVYTDNNIESSETTPYSPQSLMVGTFAAELCTIGKPPNLDCGRQVGITMTSIAQGMTYAKAVELAGPAGPEMILDQKTYEHLKQTLPGPLLNVTIPRWDDQT